MSRIGKKEIIVPKEVEVTFKEKEIVFKGPKGELVMPIRNEVAFKFEDGKITSEPRRNDKFSKSLWGTYMSKIITNITGVKDGHTKQLIVEGVGFKWDVKGDILNLSLGFSHPITKKIPQGLSVVAEKDKLNISGIDKEMITLFAMEVKRYKKPEPYKGKGIRYAGEIIRRKEGKKSA
jgi:large subunit ribosomal protein L6